jgi:hypothetical protein
MSDRHVITRLMRFLPDLTVILIAS